MRPIDKLTLNKPDHKKGLNVSVRLGTKWLGKTYAIVDGLGIRSVRCMAMRFDDVEDAVLSMFHHSAGDRLSILSDLMLWYKCKVDPHDIVTLVFYDTRQGEEDDQL